MKSLAILSAWHISYSPQKGYSTLYAHYCYLEEFLKHFDKLYLIAPVYREEREDLSLIANERIELLALPPIAGHLSAQPHFFHYLKRIREARKKADAFYVRTPDPFAYLPSFVIGKKPMVMHFVGNPLAVLKESNRYSAWQKLLLSCAYHLEEQFLSWACKRKGLTVFCNGAELQTVLLKKGIKAQQVISSTISEKELFLDPFHKKGPLLRLCYLGSLYKAKGLDLFMELLPLLEKAKIAYHLDIIGEGEMLLPLQDFFQKEGLSDKLTFHGFISSRKELLKRLRRAHIFLFPSLSEGSPRCVLEAMGQGVVVISTPVGSLPSSFCSGEELLFFPFADAKAAFEAIQKVQSDPELAKRLQQKAFERVRKEYTLAKFLSPIISSLL